MRSIHLREDIQPLIADKIRERKRTEGLRRSYANTLRYQGFVPKEAVWTAFLLVLESRRIFRNIK